MSSYAKRMMALAQRWLAVNPDPVDPFLKVPGLDKDVPRAETREQMIARLERRAHGVPEALALIADLRSQAAQADQVESELHEVETTLEKMINASPSAHQHKGEVDAVANAHLGRWFVSWARHGYNVFDLSADFTAAMVLTDAREIDIGHVRLPFAAILMVIPDGFARGAEGGHYTKVHIAEIPRAHATQLQAANDIAKVIEHLPAPKVTEVIARVEKGLDTKPFGSSTAALLAGKPDPSDVVLHIHATDGAHILETFIERRGLSWDVFDALPDNVSDDVDRQCRHTLRRIVFGALAYATAVDRAVEERDPGERRRRGQADRGPKRWDIGRTVRIDPKLVQAARAGAREVALRLKHRHIVRGHYRNQAHGPRFSERKSIWIAPFWKGPEDGAALVHTYKPRSEP